MHKLFEEFLQIYSLKEHFPEPLKDNFQKTYESLTTPEKIVSMKLKASHRTIIKKMKMLEECYTLGNMNVFNFTLSELQKEKKEIENHLAMTMHEFRNSSIFLDKAVRECFSLASLWNTLTCYGKLADIIFPDGLLYYRDTDRLEVLSENLELIQPTVQESNHESEKSIQFG